MKSLLDILKENLPAGVTLKNEKETTNRFKYDFCFGLQCISGEIFKAVAPGYEKSYVIRTIATHMVQIYVCTGEVEQAHHWLNVSKRAAAPGNDNYDE